MLGSVESQVPKLTSREIMLPNSSACDHNPPTLQTDGRTTYHGNTALRYASRGKDEETTIAGTAAGTLSVM